MSSLVLFRHEVIWNCCGNMVNDFEIARLALGRNVTGLRGPAILLLQKTLNC